MANTKLGFPTRRWDELWISDNATIGNILIDGTDDKITGSFDIGTTGNISGSIAAPSVNRSLPSNCSTDFGVIGWQDHLGATFCQEFTTPAKLDNGTIIREGNTSWITDNQNPDTTIGNCSGLNSCNNIIYNNNLSTYLQNGTDANFTNLDVENELHIINGNLTGSNGTISWTSSSASDVIVCGDFSCSTDWSLTKFVISGGTASWSFPSGGEQIGLVIQQNIAGLVVGDVWDLTYDVTITGAPVSFIPTFGGETFPTRTTTGIGVTATFVISDDTNDDLQFRAVGAGPPSTFALDNVIRTKRDDNTIVGPLVVDSVITNLILVNGVRLQQFWELEGNFWIGPIGFKGLDVINVGGNPSIFRGGIILLDEGRVIIDPVFEIHQDDEIVNSIELFNDLYSGTLFPAMTIQVKNNGDFAMRTNGTSNFTITTNALRISNGDVILLEDNQKLRISDGLNITFDGVSPRAEYDNDTGNFFFTGGISVTDVTLRTPENKDYSALDELVNPDLLTREGKTEEEFHNLFPDIITKQEKRSNRSDCWDIFWKYGYCYNFTDSEVLDCRDNQIVDWKEEEGIISEKIINYTKKECSTYYATEVSLGEWNMLNYKAVWDLNQKIEDLERQLCYSSLFGGLKCVSEWGIELVVDLIRDEK